VDTYNKYRRFYSITSGLQDFPSTEFLLTSLSGLLEESASHFDLVEETQAVKLAYSSLTRLQWVLGEQTVKNDSKVKSLQLSRDLLKELFMVSP